MSEHPQELLAEYVDGELDERDRARVERHVAGCDVCREEAELAGQARAALARLTEADPPLGVAREAVRRARRPGLAGRPVAWRVAGLAAAAAVVAGAVLVLRAPSQDMASQEAADAPAGPQPAPEETSRDAVAAEGAFSSAPLPYPTFERADTPHDEESLGKLTADLAAEASVALEGGFPPTAQAFYSSFDLTLLPAPAQRALECVNQGLPPEQSVVPFVIQTGRFRDVPVFVVAYLRGPTPRAGYDRVQLIVAEREACAIVHFARQTLS